MAEVVEYLLSTDSYNKPKVVKDKDAIMALLTRLILMDPGTNPLHPEMGVGLVRRFRFCNESDIMILNYEIERQIEMYLPQYRYAKADCYLQNSNIYINITLDDTLFSFTTEQDKSKLIPGQIVLSINGFSV